MLLAMKPPTAIEIRFWPKVALTPGCWIWQGSKRHNGYGQVFYNGRPERSHRVSWIMHHGPIPSGKWVLHRCDNRSCVNPAHLFLGTAADNTADMLRKKRHRSSPKRGEQNNFAKLSDAQVRALRRMYVPRKNRKSGKTYLSGKEVSKRFGITVQYVSILATMKTRI